MKEHNGIPLPGHEVVDANSVDFSELALRRLREGRTQEGGCAQRQQHLDDFHDPSKSCSLPGSTVTTDNDLRWSGGPQFIVSTISE
jgi:hypothetical protein